ncbi:uncharacterized protein VICG_00074 [Vittaforma corneae ATCC 50505]|uniref:Uncharacterized protein n=1 Tax=Vittaforma corneae (strain ATCC 50505) TaxID=993615 RepID=L2GQ71_VITCO|nr:uncharacterized protein VICG_00074 [Vittaforma corneae ATCC 50505]ELA42759.1 hypothetical protein VICG_00074 [Vittaforma corneae ATCC 50505]
MSSNSHTPRRSLPRYQSVRQVPSKKQPKQSKQSFTHQDFMAFIEPFYELLKKKNFEEFKKMSEVKNFDFKKEIYAKWSGCLNEKLLSSYQFDDNVEIEDVQFGTSLEPIKPIESLEFVPPFYEKNRILESYRTSMFKDALKEYKRQVERNNKRRSIILNVIPKRARYSAYFYAFDLINSKLEELQKRLNVLKKNIKPNELEADMIREYLDRIYEFFNAFGFPDQFDSDEMNYPDIIDDMTDEEKDTDLQYFK